MYAPTTRSNVDGRPTPPPRNQSGVDNPSQMTSDLLATAGQKPDARLGRGVVPVDARRHSRSRLPRRPQRTLCVGAAPLSVGVGALVCVVLASFPERVLAATVGRGVPLRRPVECPVRAGPVSRGQGETPSIRRSWDVFQNTAEGFNVFFGLSRHSDARHILDTGTGEW